MFDPGDQTCMPNTSAWTCTLNQFSTSIWTHMFNKRNKQTHPKMYLHTYTRKCKWPRVGISGYDCWFHFHPIPMYMYSGLHVLRHCHYVHDTIWWSQLDCSKWMKWVGNWPRRSSWGRHRMLKFCSLNNESFHNQDSTIRFPGLCRQKFDFVAKRWTLSMVSVY